MSAWARTRSAGDRRTVTAGVPRVLVDASNLHVGGGVQVAASVIDEMSRLDGPSWIREARYLVSSEVDADLLPTTRDVLDVRRRDTRPLSVQRWLPRRRRHDVSFLVFGPEYGWPRARRRIVGFADVNTVYPIPAGVPTPWRDRVFRTVRAIVARFLFGTADRLVVETAAMADRLVDVGVFDRDRIEVVSNSYNAVFDDPEHWTAIDLPERSADEFQLCYIARAYPHKNHAFLPRLAEAALELGVVLRFVVTLTKAEWAAMPHEMHACCANVGAVTAAQVPPIYEHVDASLFPSLLEAFSATPVESMKAGCLLFASDRDFVRAVCGDAPVYFDPLDPRTAARAVVEVLRSPQLREEHVARGRSVVADLPTAAERAAQLVRIVDDELEAAAP